MSKNNFLNMNGHISQTSYTSKVENFLIGVRNKTSIFNSDESFTYLKRSLIFLHYILKVKGNILIVNANPMYDGLVKKIIHQTDAPKSKRLSYVNARWVGGLLTNWKQVSKSISIFSYFSKHFYASTTNKEGNNQLRMSNTLRIPRFLKMSRYFEGLTKMKTLPDVLIILDAEKSQKAIKEAMLLQIPTIALVNANTSVSINFITYPIPVNQQSSQFVYFYLNLIYKLIKLS